MTDNDLYYRLDAKFTKLGPIGLTPDGIRMDNEFAGHIAEGVLTGATVTGVDYFRIRADGVGVVDGHEVLVHDGATVAVTITGYVLPPAGMPMPSPEVLLSPDFAWPDAPFTVEVFATFETGAPKLAELNRTTVVHTGRANMATGELTIYAHRRRQPESPASTRRSSRVPWTGCAGSSPRPSSARTCRPRTARPRPCWPISPPHRRPSRHPAPPSPSSKPCSPPWSPPVPD
ncbi:DUF3237 family protein [Actinophytocola sp.]|uniref:DUF3237 family protein n=1 Tax=Actinophytocola sp. TaxID=1872138 RepID=UPI003D6B9774